MWVPRTGARGFEWNCPRFDPPTGQFAVTLPDPDVMAGHIEVTGGLIKLGNGELRSLDGTRRIAESDVTRLGESPDGRCVFAAAGMFQGAIDPDTGLPVIHTISWDDARSRAVFSPDETELLRIAVNDRFATPSAGVDYGLPGWRTS
jgi:hypothetical protein